jgi:signal transduction histidine kinase
VLRAGCGWGEQALGSVVPRHEFGDGRTVVVDDARSGGTALANVALLRAHAVASFVAVALRGGDAPLGWLLVATPAATTFGDAALGFLDAAAELLGAALAHRRADAVRERARAVLEEEAAISRALLELGQTLHAHLDDPYLLDWVNTAALRLLRSDWSGVLGWDEKRHVFRLVANAGVLPREMRLQVTEVQYGPDDVPRLRALRPGDLLEVPSLEDDAIVPGELLRELRLRSALCTPVACNGEVIGIHVHGWRERHGIFRPRDRHLATGIAQATAVALDTALLVADLQMANRLKSEFLANVSHELRTPINIVAGYTEMLADGAYGAVPDEARDTLTRIQTTTRTLRDLVATTLHLGHLEAGRDSVDVETVDVATMLREIAAELAVPAEVSLQWPKLRDDLSVTTDRIKLRAIAHQLVQNALKFTEVGTVTVGIDHDGRYLTLTVGDTGIGIADEHLPMLFKPFHQIDGSNTRRHGGVGLGLHLVKRYVRLLHGDVSVTSRLGEGSTFVATVPAPLALASLAS